MTNQTKNLLIGIYFHPEAYPPTLNAITELSECFSRVTVVHRPHVKQVWAYPANVVMIPSGKHMDIVQQKAASFTKKAGLFIGFLQAFYKNCRKEKPAYILLYDSISLYAYHLLRPLLSFHHKTWYHNHDVLERSLLGKYSIGYFASKAETKAFKYLDIFSLPSDDRKKFFPLDTFQGQYFFIPNFPSRKFYGRFYRPHSPAKTVKIIFQGQVAPFRGIEQIIPLLAGSINERQMELGLVGPCDDAYKAEITQLCEKHHVTDKVHFEKLPYLQVPALSATYHVGIALLLPKDIMTTTMATASNKIYEYAAVGLPVMYCDTENFRQHLSRYTWALATKVTSEDIREKLSAILLSYDELSAAAHHDFLETLNFETGFIKVKSYINSSLHEPEAGVHS